MAGDKDGREASFKAFLQGISRSFNNASADPDITIACNGRQWLCHKVVLRGSSEWFETAFSSQFVEKDSKVITLEEDDEDTAAVGAVLEYLYTLDYEKTGEEPSVLSHARVFVLAEKYFVSRLTELAADRCSLSFPTATPSELSVAIRHTYLCSSDPTRKLKNKIVTHVVRCPSLVDGSNEDFNKLLLEIAEFGADVSRAFAQSTVAKTTWEIGCPTPHCPGGFNPVHCLADDEIYDFTCPKCGGLTKVLEGQIWRYRKN